MLVHVDIPGMSLNLQDPLLRLTGIQPRQTGGIPIGQVFTDCARDGGVRPIRLPGSGTGRCCSGCSSGLCPEPVSLNNLFRGSIQGVPYKLSMGAAVCRILDDQCRVH